MTGPVGVFVMAPIGRLTASVPLMLQYESVLTRSVVEPIRILFLCWKPSACCEGILPFGGLP